MTEREGRGREGKRRCVAGYGGRLGEGMKQVPSWRGYIQYNFFLPVCF